MLKNQVFHTTGKPYTWRQEDASGVYEETRVNVICPSCGDTIEIGGVLLNMLVHCTHCGYTAPMAKTDRAKIKA